MDKKEKKYAVCEKCGWTHAVKQKGKKCRFCGHKIGTEVKPVKEDK